MFAQQFGAWLVTGGIAFIGSLIRILQLFAKHSNRDALQQQAIDDLKTLNQIQEQKIRVAEDKIADLGRNQVNVLDSLQKKEAKITLIQERQAQDRERFAVIESTLKQLLQNQNTILQKLSE